MLEEPVAEPELLRHRGAALARDDVGADLREPPLGRVAEAVEDRSRDRELEDAVAEELEALVRGRRVLRPRGVREDLLEPVGGQLRDQAAELVQPRPVPLLALVRDDVVDRLADGRELAGVLVRDLEPELVLEVHDDLHQVERIGAEVLLERRVFRDLALVDTELLAQRAFDLLEDLLTRSAT